MTSSCQDDLHEKNATKYVLFDLNIAHIVGRDGDFNRGRLVWNPKFDALRHFVHVKPDLFALSTENHFYWWKIDFNRCFRAKLTLNSFINLPILTPMMSSETTVRFSVPVLIKCNAICF